MNVIVRMDDGREIVVKGNDDGGGVPMTWCSG
jgi:hypothetical protein